MTVMLFRDDPYLQRAEATVTGHTEEGGLILDQCLFYPQGGGQPGDSGQIEWADGTLAIAAAVKGDGGKTILVPGMADKLPPVGTPVVQILDWDRRYRHMRVHTALHLLSVVIPLPVTGGSIGAQKGRLDFLMPEVTVQKPELETALSALVERDLAVTESWITEAELQASPELVKTMSVQPPVGQGRIRLIRIGEGEDQIDLQPCGGTHVARTAEVGKLRIGKIENKGRQNRRVNLLIDD